MYGLKKVRLVAKLQEIADVSHLMLLYFEWDPLQGQPIKHRENWSLFKRSIPNGVVCGIGQSEKKGGEPGSRWMFIWMCFDIWCDEPDSQGKTSGGVVKHTFLIEFSLHILSKLQQLSNIEKIGFSKIWLWWGHNGGKDPRSCDTVVKKKDG